uniref:BTB domain-containing protein n=1 Tax=Gouania willdenowi TaxID=441366 RepID=A0A8C5G2F1_GOUWI
MDFPGHFQHMFKQLNQQRLQAQLCDCVVLVGAQTFHAHRSILAACSSHFRALLSSSDEIGGINLFLFDMESKCSALVLNHAVITVVFYQL